MTSKKFLFPLLCLVLVLSSTGCSGATIYSDYREVADLEIIRTIGIDKTENGVVIVASTGTELSSQPPKIFRAEGPSTSDALRDIQTTPLGKSLFFAHTENILIGEEAARAGISSYLDYVERSSEMHLATNMFVVKGGTAEDLIKTCSSPSSSATDMLAFLKEHSGEIGSGYVYTCQDIAASLAINGHSLIMAVESVDTNSLSKDSGEKIVRPAGFGVVKDGALIDFLTDDESRGTVLVREKLTFDSTPVDVDGTTVTLGVTGESVDISPVFKGDHLDSVSIKISIKANIEEVSKDFPVSDDDKRRKISQKLAEMEMNRVEAAVKRAQEMDIDFLGLGSAVERKEPSKYRGMSPEWESVFSDLRFNVNVSSVIRRSYDIEDPFSVSGKED